MSKINSSTFLIKSSKNKSFSTGFCVHKDEFGSYLLTCAHVVNACVAENLTVDSYQAKLLYISEDKEIMDLALIYVKDLTHSTKLKLWDGMAHEKDEFDISGYRPHKDKHAQEPLKGYIKKSYTLESNDKKQWIYELKINGDDSIEQGYSGSAVVSSQTGLVVAVATDRKRDAKNAYATPIRYLKEIWQEMPKELFVENESSNPYKGLKSFTYNDRHNYYGREKDSKEIAAKLPKTKLFTFLGASGSGKSSLLFAGVFPQIEGDEVEILSLRPEGQPFKSLATVFIPTLYPDKLEQSFLEETKAKHLYLIIDQFEEVFTLTKEQKLRQHFLDQLLTLINSKLNVTIVISMRADFLSHLSYYEPFNQAYNEHANSILSLLSEVKLKKVIEEPAHAQGVTFQDGLVDRIIDEIENEAGQLPLLEFALDQLWTNKKGRVITHDVLDEMKVSPILLAIMLTKFMLRLKTRNPLKKY